MRRAVINSDLALLDLEQASDTLPERIPRAALRRVIHGSRNIRSALNEALGVDEEVDP